MAIYTEYGRYVKAKLFKDAAESKGGIYMLLGLGNPHWDKQKDDSGNPLQPMPIASYNTSSLTDSVSSQFNDNNLQQYFYKNLGSTQTIRNGECQGAYQKYFKDILPAFPSVWQYSNSAEVSIVGSVNQSNFQNSIITKSGDQYLLNGGSSVNAPDDDLAKQYFAEMYLRGKAANKFSSVSHPVGLLGAIKCDISFVRDISEDDYNGEINKFWYGDRYWEVVESDDDDASDSSLNYVEYIKNGDIKAGLRYPHHLLFTAVINPKSLCSDDMLIDNAIVPMQIALYKSVKSRSDSYLRVGEHIFNFGQLKQSDIDGLSEADRDEVLNFTLPNTGYPAADFEFILHDYIKGSPRNAHTVDRIGYIVGF